MAYEMHPSFSDKGTGGTEGGGTEGGVTSSPYNVPPIQEAGYDFKNIINSSKDGVTYYVAELVVTNGALSVTTVTIFCHLTVPSVPVSNVLFYSLHIPPKRNYTEIGGSSDEALSIDKDGNVRYTKTSADEYVTGKEYGIATQITYWSHN